jgi:amino acid adenylation domain-containing protein
LRVNTIATPADGRQQRVSFPCSQSQKRFWFEAQLHPDNPGLNVAVRWRLEGEVSHAHLEEAWNIIIQRHATLRSFFTTVNGEPHQVVEPAVDFTIPLVDLTALGDAEAVAEAERVASLEAQRTFDITKAPLIRVMHVRERDNVSMILVTVHHTACDGWSIGVLAQEMGEACADLAAGRTPALPALPVTYADYIAWEAQAMNESRVLGSVPSAVASKLVNFQPFEILPDKPRPPVQTPNGEIVSALLERSLTDRLADVARANGSTLFMTAYAVLLVLLHRYSGQTDIVIGTQIAGREEVEFEPLVGTFINTIALRTDVSGDPPFTELLERARDTVTDALELRHLPLEELVEIVNPKRDLSRNALFSINFVYQRSFIENQTYGKFKLIDLPSRSAGPICDLNFFMVERPDGWRLSCEFNTDLYRRQTVEGMLDRFVRLMRAVVEDASRAISSFPILSEEERRRIIALGTGGSTSHGCDRTVHDIFSEEAARHPQAIAVVDEAAELTYEQLDRRSNQLSRFLVAAGIGPQTTVGVALERSLDVPVALLAILKTGATYVPLDASYPRERLAFVIQDAGVQIVLTERSLRDRLPNSGIPLIDLAETASALASLDDGAVDPAGRANSPAYIMYTSGSTGRPKGVTVPHRAIARLVRETNYVDIRADDTVLQYAPLAFDASTFEIWAPLLNGGRLAMARAGTLSLAELDRALARFSVTTLWLTAALFREAVEAKLTSFAGLRRLLAGGDVVSPVHAKRFLEAFPNCTLINGYGPTENTTFSCCYVVPSPDAIEKGVPIGRPISNSSAYVLDDRLELVPLGVVGELCVGGDGLADGYLNLPELTAERFVPDPVSGDPAARLYRTGDQVRQRDDGVIEFLGRIDGQVKVRGYRIELRELDAVLLSHPSVADAVSIATDRSGDKSIVAYVVPRDIAPGELDTAALRAWLADRLPAFMLPATIVALPALELSANGKINLSTLPAPVDSRTAGESPISSVTEARLAGILCELLHLDSIERDADLFSRGLHSMLAIRFLARVQDELGVELRLRSLFEGPTIAAIAAQIETPTSQSDGGTYAPIVTLNKNGKRPPLIFFHGDLFAEGLYARRLAAALGADQPVYSVAPHGTAGLPLLPTTEEMARDYVDRIRSIQPNGPYRLGGFCASGLVAYEVARNLQASGATVERLILLNSSPMPSQKIGAMDWLVRRLGLDARLKPRVRDSICFNLARLQAAILSGPRASLSVLRQMLHSRIRPSQTNDPLEPKPFENRRGFEATENSFAHIVAALTYHPKPYAGDITLIWGEDQTTMHNDRTVGWGSIARRVNVVPMRGGHVGALSGRIDELGRAFNVSLQGEHPDGPDDPSESSVEARLAAPAETPLGSL